MRGLFGCVRAEHEVDFETEAEEIRDVVENLLATASPANGKQLLHKLMKLPLAKSRNHLEVFSDSIIERAMFNPDKRESLVNLCQLAIRQNLQFRSSKHVVDDNGYPLQTYSFHEVLTYRLQHIFNVARIYYMSGQAALDCFEDIEPADLILLGEKSGEPKENYAAVSQFLVDLYACGILFDPMIRAIFFDQATGPLVPSYELDLQCLRRLLEVYVEKNKTSKEKLSKVAPHFDNLRKHLPSKLPEAAHYIYEYDDMKKALNILSTVERSDFIEMNPAQFGYLRTITTDADTTTYEFEGTASSTPTKLVSVQSTTLRNCVSSPKTQHVPQHSLKSIPKRRGKRRAILLPSQLSQETRSNGDLFDQLVYAYTVRRINDGHLRALESKDLTRKCRLSRPDFCYSQWAKKNGSAALVNKVNTHLATVTSLLERTERSLQQNTREYHRTVEKIVEKRIHELLDSLPANVRADVKRRAYDASLPNSSR
ncbi:hypothetical protein RvY_11296 [Ramazzottius varieornatus]|uniref:Uncharacterized protein n=1 Tax=Ramazzottius varieornatus TaxID=947166 RepID=A0A1D1VFP9_RAMVA|nr:hypothetical protein RvY_11296 [Ramazzottius varieornatus]